MSIQDSKSAFHSVSQSTIQCQIQLKCCFCLHWIANCFIYL